MANQVVLCFDQLFPMLLLWTTPVAEQRSWGRGDDAPYLHYGSVLLNVLGYQKRTVSPTPLNWLVRRLICYWTLFYYFLALSKCMNDFAPVWFFEHFSLRQISFTQVIEHLWNCSVVFDLHFSIALLRMPFNLRTNGMGIPKEFIVFWSSLIASTAFWLYSVIFFFLPNKTLNSFLFIYYREFHDDKKNQWNLQNHSPSCIIRKK